MVSHTVQSKKQLNVWILTINITPVLICIKQKLKESEKKSMYSCYLFMFKKKPQIKNKIKLEN